MIALKNILVATDFSQPSDAALLYGRALARNFNATLHVVHVVGNVSSLVYGADAYAVSIPALQQEVVLAQAVAARQFAEGEGPMRAVIDFSDVEAADIPVETLKEMGRRPQNFPGQVRIYVLPDDTLFGLGREDGHVR